jgi:glycerol-3-phosphate acyltransferase PlsY
VAVGSIAASIAFPLSVAFVKPPFENLNWFVLGPAIVLGILIIVAHRSNIKKLLGKEEPEKTK